MTNEQATAENQKYPHLSTETIAYYAGRNSIDDDGREYGQCEFTDAALVASYKRGQRSIRSELRLNADTEWDED
jgi:hypothetical protein